MENKKQPQTNDELRRALSRAKDELRLMEARVEGYKYCVRLLEEESEN